MYIEEEKQVKLITYYCLPILLLLHIMLYVMVAYLMLFAALSNAVCLYNAFFANDFCFHALFIILFGLLTQFVYFKNYFASCTVLLICWLFLILRSHRFFCFM